MKYFLYALQLALIILKLLNQITAPWLVILGPFIILATLWAAGFIIILFLKLLGFGVRKNRKEK